MMGDDGVVLGGTGDGRSCRESLRAITACNFHSLICAYLCSQRCHLHCLRQEQYRLDFHPTPLMELVVVITF